MSVTNFTIRYLNKISFLAGIYNNNDVAASFPNVISGSGSSTPVSSSHLPQQSSGHLQQVGALSPSAASSVPPAAATTQVRYC
jgi:hypothetical protein